MVRVFVVYEAEPDAERYAAAPEEFTPPVECSAFRHGKVFGSPFGEPRGSVLRRVRVGRTWRRSSGWRARPSSPRRAQTRWRWESPSPCSSRSSRSARARPSEPARPGRARLRGDRLREGAAAGDDPPQPAGRPERLRLPDAARDRARRRGRVVGRRDPRGRRHRRGPGVLRRRRPPVVGGDARRQARRSTGSGSAPSRTCTTACARSASRRSRASTGSRSAAATSSRWPATSP